MDTIAQLFTQLKNASMAGKKETYVSYSKTNLALLELLKSEGLIEKFEVEKNEEQKYPSKIITVLKYKSKSEPMFSDIKRVSRSGRRIYIPATRIGRQERGKSAILISTSKGLMTGNQARKAGLGGEVIGEIL